MGSEDGQGTEEEIAISVFAYLIQEMGGEISFCRNRVREVTNQISRQGMEVDISVTNDRFIVRLVPGGRLGSGGNGVA